MSPERIIKRRPQGNKDMDVHVPREAKNGRISEHLYSQSGCPHFINQRPVN